MEILYGLAVSLHMGFEGEYNAIHPHIRLQNDSFISGVFYNSESDLSYYAGIETDHYQWNHEFGLVIGYNSYEVLPYFRSTYNINENIIGYITPAIENESIGIVVGLEIRSKK